MTKFRHFEDVFKSGPFYRLEKFCDVTIVAEDGFEFKAHKLFLSKESGYFRAFFRYSTGEEGNIVVLSFDKAVLEKILIFLYTQEVYLEDKNAADMIIAADYLLTEKLLTKCKTFVLEKICLENCFSLLVASYIVERLGVKECCYRFAQVHFEQLVLSHGSGLSELHLECLKSLLSDDSLGVNDELIVWRAVTLWINGNEGDRLKFLPELLPCIRLKSSDCLTSIISQHPLFQKNPFCKSINLEEMAGSVSNEESDRCPKNMCIFFWPNPDYKFDINITYDEKVDIWRKIGETDTKFQNMVAIDQYIFIFNTMTNTVKAFDMIEKIWVKKNNLGTSRQSYHVVRSQNCIWALGGYFFMSHTHLDEVEYYLPITDNWSYSKPVPPVNICGVAVINEMIYVMGYIEHPDNVEMRALVYDITCNVWSDIAKPKHFRTNFGICGFKERLYIFGGRTENYTVTTSVEVYDPGKKEWEFFQQLPFPFELPRATVLGDKLVVYDECPNRLYFTRFSPCLWNEEDQLWEIQSVTSPFNEIHKYKFCCIEDRSVLLELNKENRDASSVWTKTPFARY